MKRLAAIGIDGTSRVPTYDRVLGCVRRIQPSGAGHDLRHGALAAGAAAQPQPPSRVCCSWSSRSPTTTRPAAARSQGSAGDDPVRGRERQTVPPPEYGNVSTASIGAIQRGLLTLEQQGADKFFGEPMLEYRRPDADRRRRARGDQRAGGRQALQLAQAVFPPSCCGCWPNCSRTCPRWATWKNRRWCSSSTRPTCSSTMPRGPAGRSSRWCG